MTQRGSFPYFLRGFLIVLLCLSFQAISSAVETHTGTVRIPSEVTCINNCDNYSLEPDAGSEFYFLRGVDLILYVGRRVQVWGYRSYCGGCLVIYVTEITRLPLTDVRLIDDHLPQKTQLLQNYPNPFNPATVITYNITTYDHVEVKVYDVVGREVATLVSAYQSPGSYELSWNAAEFPSGLYYYRLQTAGTTFMKKMIFMK